MSIQKDATSAAQEESGTRHVTDIPHEAYPVEVEEAIAAAYHGFTPVQSRRQEYVRHFSTLLLSP
jgi:hypothetical protein